MASWSVSTFSFHCSNDDNDEDKNEKENENEETGSEEHYEQNSPPREAIGPFGLNQEVSGSGRNGVDDNGKILRVVFAFDLNLLSYVKRCFNWGKVGIRWVYQENWG